MSARTTALVLLAAVVAALPAERIGAQEQLPTFRSMANAVAVDVTVRDSKRKSVTGLKASDFEVYDNGVRQEVAEVSYGKLPIDVTVALDVSFSVTGLMLERLRSGVVTLMRDLAREDRLKLMLFNSRVARVVDFTNDEKKVEAAIKTAAAGGGTALFDSISVALVSAAPRDRRQLVVVFTDGERQHQHDAAGHAHECGAAHARRGGDGPSRQRAHGRRHGSTSAQQVFSSMKMSLMPQPYDGFFQSLAIVDRRLRGADECLVRSVRRLPPDSRGVQVRVRAALRRQRRGARLSRAAGQTETRRPDRLGAPRLLELTESNLQVKGYRSKVRNELARIIDVFRKR